MIRYKRLPTLGFSNEPAVFGRNPNTSRHMLYYNRMSEQRFVLGSMTKPQGMMPSEVIGIAAITFATILVPLLYIVISHFVK